MLKNNLVAMQYTLCCKYFLVENMNSFIIYTEMF